MIKKLIQSIFYYIWVIYSAVGKPYLNTLISYVTNKTGTLQRYAIAATSLQIDGIKIKLTLL